MEGKYGSTHLISLFGIKSEMWSQVDDKFLENKIIFQI